MILEKARELGMALCQSEEFTRLQITQNALEADEVLCGILQEFREKQAELVELLQQESGMDRLLVAGLSRDIESLQTQLLENPIFAATAEAQNRFSELMSAVNREIGTCIGMAPTENGGCGGSCDSCSGCH